MYSWSDEVDVILDVFRNAVFLAGNVSLPSARMLVLKVLGIQQSLCFRDCCIKMQPTQTLRLLDALF